MGKIFGISDNPVSTIDKAIQPLILKGPKVSRIKPPKNQTQVDKFVSKDKQHTSNPFVKMRNGIGRLMSHFSKKKTS